MNNKKTGAYYTPKILSQFLVNHIFNKYIKDKNDLVILEPSSGDGEFIKALKKRILDRRVSLDIVDIDNNELLKAKGEIAGISDLIKIRTFNKDYLNFENKNYSLIIGNPPYISKTHLNKSQIEKCKKICKDKIPGYGEVKNIWPAFLIKAIDQLDKNGIICYVLPSELLQVKYTSGLRRLILDSFERVEIFAFNELIFNGIEQDVIAFIGVKKHILKKEKGVSFYQVNRLEDLKIPNYTEKHFNVNRGKLDKWTNYILTTDQLSIIDKLTSELELKTIGHYCKKAEVGIVTAANNFFIRKKSEIESFRLNGHIKPILQKSNVIKRRITITEDFIEELNNKDSSVNFVSFKNVQKKELSKSALLYIDEGEKQLLHERYKMKKRINWYHVPSIWSSEAIFSKRSHLYPRVFFNEANVLVTDSFYRIICKEDYDVKKFVFSFYNSLTLVLAELEGRFYGGGVLELIPSEFKNLLIPYNDNITQEQFTHLERLFHDGEDISEILNFTDPILFPSIDSERITYLRNIRQILFNRRTKSKLN